MDHSEEAEACLIEKAYLKLTEDRYPEGSTKNERRSIRRKATTLAVEDGVLYYKKRDGKKVLVLNYYVQYWHAYQTIGHCMGIC